MSKIILPYEHKVEDTSASEHTFTPRITFSPPICDICNEEVDTFEMHSSPIWDTDDNEIIFVAKCHGAIDTCRVRESEMLQLQRLGAFNNMRRKVFNGRAFRIEKLIKKEI
jgi:hypothetical protein